MLNNNKIDLLNLREKHQQNCGDLDNKLKRIDSLNMSAKSATS
jgi:hypothetical protein